MDMLAKHFFDFQSFINLPHKAVQLHKTPHSEAGVDPSASWAPKNMQVQGKNMAAPQARANRSNVEARPGTHRHGRPSKLEFRRWGERRTELKEEKIIPHKDKWMIALDGDFRHFHEEPNLEKSTSRVTDFLTRRFKNKRETNFQILSIVTLTAHADLISVTIKRLRGMEAIKEPSIRIQLFDGSTLIEQRSGSLSTVELENRSVSKVQNGPMHFFPSSPQLRLNHLERRLSIGELPNTDESIGESFLFHISALRLYSSFVVMQIFGKNSEGVEKTVGICAIGMGAAAAGVRQWRQMIQNPGRPVCSWHSLLR